MKNKLRKLLIESNINFRELTEEEENNPFAVFVIVFVKGGYVLATTRAEDKGEGGKIGLPGGKVDPGESPVDAVYREAAEEGWKITKIGEVVSSQIIEGKPVVWYLGYGGKKLTDYKEKGRIKPIMATIEEISNSGYGNSFISKIK